MSVEQARPDGRTPDETPASGLRKVVGASMAGTVVEWYEFFLYGTAATLVFSKVFFPDNGNELDAIIAAFVTYAVGFVARPLGGVVFGHFGDKFGRKKLLQTSLVLVGVATFLMGCLPTFGAIGYWAPALLVTLRFVQGFAVGGEWGGAVLLVAEHSPNRSRGFWASWPQAGVPMGNLVATVVLLILTTTLSDAAFLSWGWRIAFWLSAVIVLVGYYIRTKVTDAPIFLEAQREAEQIKSSSYSVVEVVKRYPRGVFTAMGLRFAENVMYYLVVTFSITYLKVVVGANTSTILWWMLAAHAVHFAIIPVVGRLSDTFGRRPVYMVGAVTAGTWGFFAFPMMDSGHNALVMSAIVIGLVFHAFMYAGQPAIMAEMFPTRMRYAGVSLGYQVTSIVAGSLAPIIATALLSRYGSAVPIAIYLAVASVVTIIAVVAARETKGISLRDIDAADARAVGAEKTAVSA
ncbi:MULTISPECIES: MFS transporter [Rhodococcus]|jgi:MFS family permease|uniref:Putative proline/betaine transporter n=1 Tax=Rhodococcus aetherivorans TaxID=191292 RepID=A0A059MG96_9NOCA|nr:MULTISPECIES: MFS transporter [Rhodococcus]ETT26663.1 General substrate transporter [Rhodococcus rhodochrous ATCC 21198]NCL78520.1 Inner membrane metabolite transport protein YhjE [Rhodococcus sp. YH1]ANZ27193.1 MFS transporter [Rhodococcus sp. WB1]KDE10113.1 MFS transporter [Rhodococcus aetherivorans]MBC2592295.1 MHS family MFS transporter [Rhodococcus aetherivorans]